MAAYILYNLETLRIIGMHTTGSATRPGADIRIEDLLRDPEQAALHAIWKVSPTFFEKVRPEILHELSTYSRVILNDSMSPIGVVVDEAPTIKHRLYQERHHSMSMEMFNTWTQLQGAVEYLKFHPEEEVVHNVADKLQIHYDQVSAQRARMIERFTTEGELDLPPILNEKAGQKIDE